MASTKTYKILFLGDIVGRPGRQAVLEQLPFIKEKYQPLFTIVNGENSASGLGITPDIADTFFKNGIDAITLGNHSFDKREIIPYIDTNRPILRPANMPSRAPGRGLCYLDKGGIKLAVVSVSGRVMLPGYDDPFASIDGLIGQIDTPHIFVDFHAEATSEKQAFGFYVDGKVSGVVGTHTHIPTADAQVLPQGTGYITDVGMCGPYPSVLGMDKAIVLRRFLTSMPGRFEPADAPGVISGVILDVYKDTGRAASIKQILKVPWRQDLWP